MQDQDQDNDGSIQQAQQRKRPILVDKKPHNRPRYDPDDDPDVQLIQPLDPALNWSAIMSNTTLISLAALTENYHAYIR